MNYSKKPVAATCAAACAAAVAIAAICAYAAPGSNADPIALKSYVDSKFAALEGRIAALSGGQSSGGQAAQGAGVQAAGAQAQAAGAQAAGTQAARGQTAQGADVAALAAKVDELSKTVASLKAENDNLRRAVSQMSGDSGAGAPIDLSASAASGTDRFEVREVFANQRVICGAGAEIVLRAGKALAIRGEYGALVDLITGQDLDAGASIPQNHLILSPRDDNRGVRVTENAYILIKGGFSIR